MGSSVVLPRDYKENPTTSSATSAIRTSVIADNTRTIVLSPFSVFAHLRAITAFLKTLYFIIFVVWLNNRRNEQRADRSDIVLIPVVSPTSFIHLGLSSFEGIFAPTVGYFRFMNHSGTMFLYGQVLHLPNILFVCRSFAPLVHRTVVLCSLGSFAHEVRQSELSLHHRTFSGNHPPIPSGQE